MEKKIWNFFPMVYKRYLQKINVAPNICKRCYWKKDTIFLKCNFLMKNTYYCEGVLYWYITSVEEELL